MKIKLGNFKTTRSQVIRAAKKGNLVSRRLLAGALSYAYLGDWEKGCFSIGKEFYRGTTVGAKAEIWYEPSKTKPNFFNVGIRHMRGGEYVSY